MERKWFAPLLVLLGGGTWLGWQQLEISKLNQLAAPSGQRADFSLRGEREAFPDAPFSYLDPSGKVDFVMLSSAAKGELTHDGRTIHGFRAGIRLNLEMQKMSVGDLLDLADRLPNLDLPDDQRQSLLNTVRRRLAQESPRDALKLMSGEIDSQFNLVKQALQNLLSENPYEVAAWIDQHEEQLRADSKRLSISSSRILKLETALAPHLLKVDPEALHARLQGLTPKEASILISSLPTRRDDPDLLKAVITLARRSDRSESVARNLSFSFPRDDLSAATETMTEFDLIGAERDAFILGTATNFGAQEKEDLSHLDDLYEWLQAQPEDSVAPMSRALITSYEMNDGNPGQYERTIAKIAELGGTSSSNELLKQFAKKTVCVPHCRCHNSLKDRLESLQSPDLKKALAEANQAVLKENTENSKSK